MSRSTRAISPSCREYLHKAPAEGAGRTTGDAAGWGGLVGKVGAIDYGSWTPQPRRGFVMADNAQIGWQL